MNSDSSLFAFVVREGDDYKINGRQIENGTCPSESMDSARNADHPITKETKSVHCNTNCFDDIIRARCATKEQETMIEKLSSEIYEIKVELRDQKNVSAQESASLRNEIRHLKDRLDTFEGYSLKNILTKLDKQQNVIDMLVAEKELLVRSNEKMSGGIKSLIAKTSDAPLNVELEINSCRGADGFGAGSMCTSSDHTVSSTKEKREIVEIPSSRGEEQLTVVCVQEPQECTAYTVLEPDSIVERSDSFSENCYLATAVSDGPSAASQLAAVQDGQESKYVHTADRDAKDEAANQIIPEDGGQDSLAKDDGRDITTVGLSRANRLQAPNRGANQERVKNEHGDCAASSYNVERSSVEIDGKSIEIYRYSGKNQGTENKAPGSQDPAVNPIGFLQEACAARGWDLPEYEFSMDVQVADGNYSAKCSVRGHSVRGVGHSKKSAKRQAATAMCRKHFAERGDVQL